MTQVDAPSAYGVGHYAAVVRRQWKTVVLLTLLGALLAAAFLLSTPTVVNATTDVKIDVISIDPFNTSRSESDVIDPQTEIQLASSSAVLAAVATQLPSNPSTDEVRRNLSVSQVPDATVMQVTYSAADRAEAESGADLVAEEYLAYRASEASDKVQTIVDQLGSRRDDIRQLLVEVNGVLAKAQPQSNAASQAASDRQLLNIELDSLLGQINALRGLDTRGGVVVTSAVDNPVTIAPSPTVVMLTGTAAGLALGLVLAFAFNATRGRVRGGRDVTAMGAGPLIASLESSEARFPPPEADLDVLREVRERLLALLPDHGGVLAVADAGTTAGSSDVAMALAYAVSETGRPVHLLMPDAAPEMVKRIESRLAARAHGESALDQEALLAHDSLPLRATVTSTKRLTQTLEVPVGAGGGRERAGELVIVGLPKSASKGLMFTAARLSHAVIVVATEGGTLAREVRRLAEELRGVGSAVQGVVLVAGRDNRDFK